MTTLGEVVERSRGLIKTGPFGSQLHADEYVKDPEGVPVLMPNNIVEGRISCDGIKRVGEDTADRLRHHRVEAGDIVLARRGEIGRLALIGSDEQGWLCGTGSMRIHLADHGVVDPRFLSYLLAGPEVKSWLNRQAVGATMPNLNADIVAAVPVRLPCIAVQWQIAAVLSAFDDLIAICKRRIGLLEAILSSFFRHEIPSDGGVDNLPRGWRLCPLGEILDLKYGKALPKGKRRLGDVPVVSSAGVIDNHDEPLVPGPGIVIGRKGNVGSVWWVDKPFFPIDTTYYVHSDVPLGFLYWLLRDIPFLDSHAAVPGLSRSQALGTEVVMPPESIVTEVDIVHRTIFTATAGYRAIAERCAAIRDLLLPRLVSGQLDVADVDLGILAPGGSE